MKTTATREAAARRQARTPAPQRAAHKPTQADWAWPGVTRAQLRDDIIEMIG